MKNSLKTLDLNAEKKNLQMDLSKWFKTASQHFVKIPVELDKQIKVLNNLRKDVYEDINQLQHKALIISAALYLSKIYPKVNKWTWHPMQTSDKDFGDLTGFHNRKLLVNAEATTSLNPNGTIDTRMRNTLLSLSSKKGDKFYFVQTEAMKQRALTKCKKNELAIKVIII